MPIRSISPSRPPLPAAAAYGRLLAVTAVLFGPDMGGAAAEFARLLGAENAHWPQPPGNSSAPSIIVASAWLLWMVRRRHGARTRWAGGLSAAALLAGAVLAPLTASIAEAVGVVLLTVVGGALALAVIVDAGMAPSALGFIPAKGRRGRRRPTPLTSREGAAQAGMALSVSLAGFLVTDVLENWLWSLPWPRMTESQGQVLDLHGAVQYAANVLAAGAREEVPLLALPVVLLTAARRPAWEIYAVACTLRITPHLYFGFPALAVAAFTCTHVWIFQRTRRAEPIIAGHTLSNALAAYAPAAALVTLAASAAPAALVLLSGRLGRPPRLGTHVNTTARPTEKEGAA
ncbi:hypothetical protein [Actinomadura rayongensis]|uniref:CPBP family intramembrane metalloprotease n=1 Tax=Actinomadura rayongensis TaxID=1429076 RepID=A0A6I4W7M2_9ACTN|nr:hypothetical protein [Actinomadura rayongensis]MXQ65608.1 hypothetical protein [Actinomadura rayongensis]